MTIRAWKSTSKVKQETNTHEYTSAISSTPTALDYVNLGEDSEIFIYQDKQLIRRL